MRTLTALMLFALATPAMAFTGNDYLKHKDGDEQYLRGFVEGALLGIVHQYENFGAFGYCAKFPDNIDAEQQMRIVDKFLEEHPEDTHLPLELLVIQAFNLAYGTRVVNDKKACD